MHELICSLLEACLKGLKYDAVYQAGESFHASGWLH